jgi:hypothetical protein
MLLFSLLQRRYELFGVLFTSSLISLLTWPGDCGICDAGHHAADRSRNYSTSRLNSNSVFSSVECRTATITLGMKVLWPTCISATLVQLMSLGFRLVLWKLVCP